MHLRHSALVKTVVVAAAAVLVGTPASLAAAPELDLTGGPPSGVSDAIEARWGLLGGSADQFHVTLSDASGIVEKAEAEGDVRKHLFQDVDPEGTYTLRVEAIDAGNRVFAEEQVDVRMWAATSAAAKSFQAEGGFDATLQGGCDAADFPFVRLQIRVEEDGELRTDLRQENFTCFEDGREQTDLFDVDLPGETRPADVVFLLDDSVSMVNDIVEVRENVGQFARDLADSGIDFRLGLVRLNRSPSVFNGGELTDDVELFESWVDSFNADGSGVEQGYLAIRRALSQIRFRPGAATDFIIITDEDSDEPVELVKTIQAALDNGVTVHAAVDCAIDFSEEHYCRDCDLASQPLSQCSVRGATGGILLPVRDPLDPILDEIVNRLSGAYIASYRSSNPSFDGKEREVECVVTDQDQQDSVTCSYVPGAAPRIVRTEDTIALSRGGRAPDQPLTIQADITDDSAPFVEATTLFYRKTGSGDFASTAMQQLGDTLYSAEIPATAVEEPGVDYYIRASDGTLSASDPSTEPSRFPYQIAVLPNVAPEIVRTPATVGLETSPQPVGSPLTIEADIEDTTNALDATELLWREFGDVLYTSAAMKETTEGRFAATIPGADVGAAGVEYFVRATDDFGLSATSGTADAPYLVETEGDACAATASAQIDGEPSECSGGEGTVMLDGSASTVSVGDPVYEWSSAGCSFDDPSATRPVASCPAGSSQVTVTVRADCGATDSVTLDVSIEDTLPPEGGVTAPADGACFGSDALPVTVSAAFDDQCEGEISPVLDPAASFSEHGDQVVTATASDSAGNSATDDVAFTIDTVAPNVQILAPRYGLVLPATDPLPVSSLIASGDADGAAGAVVHERVLLEGCTIFDGNVDGDGDGLLTDEELVFSRSLLCEKAAGCGLSVVRQPTVTVEAYDCGGNRGVAVREWPRKNISLYPGLCTTGAELSAPRR